MSAKKIRARKVWISDEIPGETVNNPDVTMCRIEMVPQLGDELYYLLHAASYDARVEQVVDKLWSENLIGSWESRKNHPSNVLARRLLASLGLTRPASTRPAKGGRKL